MMLMLAGIDKEVGDLEEIINALLSNEKLESRIRFRPTGEELGGSFFTFQKYFLAELKWHAK
jgi:hypothetical protein